MRLSITSDAISNDLETALEVMNEFNCREFELRGVGFDTLPEIDERWLAIAEKAVSVKRNRVTSLALNLFHESADAPAEAEFEKLQKIAARLRCNTFVVFGLPLDIESDDDEEPEESEIPLPPDKILQRLRDFAAKAAQLNGTVLIRTHPDTYAGTAEEALALLNAINAPNVWLDWDVAGSFAAGDTSGLDAVEIVLPKLKNVRVQDAVRKGLGADAVSLGKGVIPWQDILEQLWEGGYRGQVTLDPGVTPKLRESRAALPLVARWIDACRMRKRE